MQNEFSRTQNLLGKKAMKKLAVSKVAVFGIGGVGSYVTEALARSGVGRIALFDNDTVSITNINRQLIATHKTIGRAKIEVMRERILDINPNAEVELHNIFYTVQNADQFDLSKYSYIVDAVDTVSSKLILIENSKKCGVPIISCMGAGNKLDPTKFEVSDIYKTSVCPLARVMRNELRKRKIKSLKVVYSKEPPLTPLDEDKESNENAVLKQVPGSIAFVPSVAGLIIAGEVIKDLADIKR